MIVPGPMRVDADAVRRQPTAITCVSWLIAPFETP